jgi:hypothetical protein
MSFDELYNMVTEDNKSRPIPPVTRSEFNSANLTDKEVALIKKIGEIGSYCAEKQKKQRFVSSSANLFFDLDAGKEIDYASRSKLEALDLAGFSGSGVWLTERGISFYRATKA